MRWYRRFFRRGLTERQLDRELRFHLEQQAVCYRAALLRISRNMPGISKTARLFMAAALLR